ncbi:hypothetical protein FDP41_006640 [Naegleria fowleri]|uniref:Uncharacterized protein n=1 Tax=Naegleria fowleri TaxID=5763 RepID=A0A6A5BKD6_NAEFO|nr:uncharacterized protein FDP41_006640 [Naegleria fowleri]KAF0974608.1 hypothetical protein FDP41_006640 [Naegleria fowleri]CAG4719547.1 unnamed protein product [Naegleria fowleri]
MITSNSLERNDNDGENDEETNEMIIQCLKFIQEKVQTDAQREVDDSEPCYHHEIPENLRDGDEKRVQDDDKIDHNELLHIAQIEANLKEHLMKNNFHDDNISREQNNDTKKLDETNHRALCVIRECIKQKRENFANIVWREWSKQFSQLLSTEESVNELVWRTGLNLLKSFLPIEENDEKHHNHDKSNTNNTEEINDYDNMCFLDSKNTDTYALYIQYLLAAENSQKHYEDFLEIVDWFFAYNAPSEEIMGSVLNAYGKYLIEGNHAYVMFDLISRNRHTFENNVDLTLFEEIINECAIHVKDKNQWCKVYTFRKEWLIEIFEKYGTTSENCFLELIVEICFSIVKDYSTVETEPSIDFFGEHVDKEEMNLKKRMEYLEKMRIYTLQLPHLRDRFIDIFGDENAQNLVNAYCFGKTPESMNSGEMSLLDLSLLKLIEQQRYDIEQMNKRHEDLIAHIQRQDMIISSLVNAVNRLSHR